VAGRFAQIGSVVSSALSSAGANSERKSSERHRWYSIAMLCVVLWSFYAVGRTAYLTFTDSFVAPSILSPESDIVMTSKLRLNELLVERSKSLAEVATLRSDIDESRATLTRIVGVQAQLRKAIRGSMRAQGSKEVMDLEQQSLRFELDAMRLTSDIRAKQVQVDTLSERISKNDQIAVQLRNKPIFRAAERRVNVAFVPYTQLEGVVRGARVFDCVLGLFWCDSVGWVDEVLPGEVVVPDPWGSLARGQYAVLNLKVPDAAKAKILRIRGNQSLSERLLAHFMSSSES
jgi:hypothetical protein